MCGLAGFWHPRSSAPDGQLHEAAGRMADALVHRGPDDRGTWVDEQAGVALGFRRLAILDLSPAGHQPMVSRDGRYVVVYNGEIYNYRDLRAELEGLGAALPRHVGHRGHARRLRAVGAGGDARAAVGGMFAFALWDRTSARCALARDRLGEKPLYYGWCGGALPVRLRAEGAARAPGLPTRVSTATRLPRSCASTTCPRPHSIYEGIRKLAPGAYAVVVDGQRARVVTATGRCARWRPTARRGRPASTTPARSPNSTRCCATPSRRRMVADVPLGAFLSGGIDSSAVVAADAGRERASGADLHDRLRRAPITTRRAHAQAVAAHLGTEHTELYVTPAQARGGDPAPGARSTTSRSPTRRRSRPSSCRRSARRDVTVALSGDGGDELFGGYNRYLWAPRVARRTAPYPAWAARAWRREGPDRVGARHLGRAGPAGARRRASPRARRQAPQAGHGAGRAATPTRSICR